MDYVTVTICDTKHFDYVQCTCAIASVAFFAQSMVSWRSHVYVEIF